MSSGHLVPDETAPGKLRSQTRKCPHCDAGCRGWSPTLLWDLEAEYLLELLDVDSPARGGAERWLAEVQPGDPVHPFLVLGGTFGTGKTHSAMACGFALTRAGLRVHYQTAEGVLRSLRATFGRDDGPTEDAILIALQLADVLILDDLGAESQSDWASTKIEDLVNDRYAQKRLTIITINTNPAVAPRTRLWSRVLGARTLAVDTSGPDRRRKM